MKHELLCHYCGRDCWGDDWSMVRWLVEEDTIVDFSIACRLRCVDEADKISKSDFPNAVLLDHHFDHFSDGHAREAWREIWAGRTAARTSLVLAMKEVFDALHDRTSNRAKLAATKSTKRARGAA